MIAYVVISLVVVHFIIGGIRGLYRHGMIQKYRYDYYDAHPRSFIGKILHNLNYGIFSWTTFFISLSLVAIAFFVVHVYQQN